MLSAFEQSIASQLTMQRVDDKTYHFTGTLPTSFNVGDAPNGGYLAALAGRCGLRAVCDAGAPPMIPGNVAVSFVSKSTGGSPMCVVVNVLRVGRSSAMAVASIRQDTVERVRALLTYVPPPEARAADAQCVRWNAKAASQRVLAAHLVPTIANGQRGPIQLVKQLEMRYTRMDEGGVGIWVRFHDEHVPDVWMALFLADAVIPHLLLMENESNFKDPGVDLSTPFKTKNWYPTLSMNLTVHGRPVSDRPHLFVAYKCTQCVRGVFESLVQVSDYAGNVVVTGSQLAMVVPWAKNQQAKRPRPDKRSRL